MNLNDRKEVRMLKHLTLRLEDEFFANFNGVCKKKGYSKSGVIKAMLREFLQREKIQSLPEEELTKEEMLKVGQGLEEIAKGEVVKLEELGHGL